MNAVSGGTLIATSEARNACKGEPDIVERIKKAMRATHDHWMETNQGEQFRAAVAAAILESPDVEKPRIRKSAEVLAKLGAALSAAQAGVAVDFSSALPDSLDDIIPLRALWEETRQ